MAAYTGYLRKACVKDAVGAGIVPHRPFDQQGEFEARSLPWNPDNLVAEDLVEFVEPALAVSARGQRDRPVGV